MCEHIGAAMCSLSGHAPDTQAALMKQVAMDCNGLQWIASLLGKSSLS